MLASTLIVVSNDQNFDSKSTVETKHSRTDQVKFVEDRFKKLEGVWSA